MKNRIAMAALCLGVGGWLAPVAASAFGPDGHRIAGLLAEPLLCDAAAAQIAALTRAARSHTGLDEIGLWADRIRAADSRRHTRPWHYLNIADGETIASFRHPVEGDVLWAIEHFSERLAHDPPYPRAVRLEALRFLVHFIVDIHQPLHVGRESDRGGNTIEVRVEGRAVNLHRFWDTEALRMAGSSAHDYAAGLVPVMETLLPIAGADSPRDWAAESLALRPSIYAFEGPARGVARLERDYLDRAEKLTRMRLAQAALRLAATLNRLLAPGSAC